MHPRSSTACRSHADVFASPSQRTDCQETRGAGLEEEVLDRLRRSDAPAALGYSVFRVDDYPSRPCSDGEQRLYRVVGYACYLSVEPEGLEGSQAEGDVWVLQELPPEEETLELLAELLPATTAACPSEHVLVRLIRVGCVCVSAYSVQGMMHAPVTISSVVQ